MVSRLVGPFAALAFVSGCSPAAAPRVAGLSRADGDVAWGLLTQRLPGTWAMVRRAEDAGKPPFVVAYRLVSNGSALVEDWGEGSAHETETVFHRDHADVVLTHYCAQGNQPRLRAAEVRGDAVVFRFADVTDRDADEAMLVERALRVTADAIEDTEVYRAADGTEDRTVYRFARAGGR
jgi:hypothetical protein